MFETANLDEIDDERLEWYLLTPLSALAEVAETLGELTCSWEGRLTWNPIRKVHSTFSANQVRHLLMGSQAYVLYGGAEFSPDADCF